MFTLENLRLFKLAAELGSFSSAAKSKKCAVSTVSKAIAELETDLGVQLFDRSRRIPKLTDSGERLLVKARLLFQHVDNIGQLAQEMINETESHIRLGVGPLVTGKVYDTAISRLARMFPNVRVSLIRESPHRLQQLVLDQKVDMAVMTHMDSDESRLSAEGLTSIPLVLVCSPDSELLDQQPVDGQVLYTTRQIVCTGMLDNPRMQLWIYSADIWDATNQEDMMRLVEQDLGWACLPQEMAEERFQLGTLSRFDTPANKGNLSLDVDLVRLNNVTLGPVCTTLAELLAQQDS
ncbi:LysR family transcriptional regulator [Paraferrimonas sedimenticola]|uniref:HTH lysR-type domain-containing protein n=1 Tax=Paraferrimonas sedimenticola TaxID=375674 RepID=A0AA37RVL3_9GAMM|nr:LysR family transcriptional regulator [Paraferrimonas sedimenticola]GLP96225.1 hypothetical protein GCM10007895_15310 [Paraferrimonas sedimenticola]